ncbi:MAG: Asp-tRNA(Asn)/Glu-tRNA(Gln) amidotransferase subunit GatC [Oscillospiraceae bacterium]
MFDSKLTAHLAELSKINFTDDEINVISGQMSAIVSLMDTVTDFNTDEIFATVVPTQYEDLREDKIENSFAREQILQNAHEKSDTCFKVPKVV